MFNRNKETFFIYLKGFFVAIFTLSLFEISDCPTYFCDLMFLIKNSDTTFVYFYVLLEVILFIQRYARF